MPPKQTIGAVSGIVAPIITFSFILIAIQTSPQFNWTNNALSDLGVTPGLTAPLFNFGLAAGGLLGFLFATFGLSNYLGKHWVGKIGVAVFAVATFDLILIGVFNESFSPTHFLVSVTFFVTVPIALFIITGTFALRHQAKMALFTFLIAFSAASPWILYFTINYVLGKAIPEIISGLAGALWIIVLATKILTFENQVKQKFANNK